MRPAHVGVRTHPHLHILRNKGEREVSDSHLVARGRPEGGVELHGLFTNDVLGFLPGMPQQDLYQFNMEIDRSI